MTPRKNVVSLYPWFKIHAGKIAEFKAMLPRFIQQTSTESACLFYDFTFNGDVVHCREAYVGAAGALTHLQNVGALLGEALKISDIQQLEVHGSAENLAQMKDPMKDLPVAWFTFEAGLEK